MSSWVPGRCPRRYDHSGDWTESVSDLPCHCRSRTTDGPTSGPYSGTKRGETDHHCGTGRPWFRGSWSSAEDGWTRRISCSSPRDTRVGTTESGLHPGSGFSFDRDTGIRDVSDGGCHPGPSKGPDKSSLHPRSFPGCTDKSLRTTFKSWVEICPTCSPGRGAELHQTTGRSTRESGTDSRGYW